MHYTLSQKNHSLFFCTEAVGVHTLVCCSSDCHRGLDSFFAAGCYLSQQERVKYFCKLERKNKCTLMSYYCKRFNTALIYGRK